MLILVWLALLAWPAQAQAHTYYAGAVTDCGSAYQCGNDSNDGLTADRPKTLTTLLTTVTAGDTLMLMCGTYYDAAASIGNPVYDFTNSGTSGTPITVRSFLPLCAHIAVLNDDPIGRAWYTNGKNYLTFDGLSFKGQMRISSCTGCVVKNSEFTVGNWDGSSINVGLIVMGCTRCLIQDNYVHGLVPRNTAACLPYAHMRGGHNNGGIMVFSGTTETIVEHNYVDDSDSQYTHANASCNGADAGLWPVMWGGIVEKGGNIHGNTYRRNIIVGTRFCFVGMASTDGSLHSYDQEVYENLCIGTAQGGIDFDHFTRSWNIYNNTWVNIPFQVFGFGSYDSSQKDSGNNRDHSFWNNLFLNCGYIYRRETSFLPTYDGNHVTNLLAPWPTLTASAAGGSLATGTYWVRISTDNSGVETGTGPSRNVAVTGPTGSITVDFDRTAGSPTSYRIYYGTTDYAQTTYITVAATGSAGSAQTATITGSGASTGAYPKTGVNQWQWVHNLERSDYNAFYEIGAMAKYRSGSSTYGATLKDWVARTETIGNAGINHGAYDTHSISSNPRVDAAAWNFRPPLTSPLRQAGLGGVHIGAYPADDSPEIGPRNGYFIIRRPSGSGSR